MNGEGQTEYSFLTVGPRNFDVTDADGLCIARRMQVPLLPAWALTVHKAQGMTLDKVYLDARSLWEEGQLYAGSTRVRRFFDQRIRAPSVKPVLASREVIDWDRSIPWLDVDNGPTAVVPTLWS